MREFIFTWIIENISHSWHRTGDRIVSPKFFASSIYNTAWTLALYPRGTEKNSDYLGLYLHRERDNVPINLAVNFELSCVSIDTSVLHFCFIPETFTTFPFDRNTGYGESRFIKRCEVFDKRKELYLPQDVLTLQCRLWKNEDDDEFGKTLGRTQFSIERIVSVENIHLEHLMEKSFNIQSRNKNETLISFNIQYYGDKINLSIQPMSEDMTTSTFKLTFVDKRTGHKLCEHISCFFSKPHEEKWHLKFSENFPCTKSENTDVSTFELTTEFSYSTGEEIKMIEKEFPNRIPEYIFNYINSWGPNIKLIDNQSISKGFWNLREEGFCCDVELKTQRKSFFVHKCILCARSSVFLAMLTRDMKEKTTKCIDIEDISDDTLEKFLIFLYTDAFEDLEWNTAVELFYTADKYQVELLKLLCSSYLLKNFQFEKVCDLLILADRHQDCELKRKVHDFIWKNEDKVFRSSMWKKFADDQPQLAINTMLSKYEEKDNQSSTETYDDAKISIHPKFLDDLKSLYERQIVRDFIIITETSKFPVHKIVLCAGSVTMREKILNKEFCNNHLEIVDLEDETVSRMLLFLYTGSFEDPSWEIALKLYRAAVMYQIEQLKIRCSLFLLESLKVSNASDLLLLAHKHQDDKLKSAVVHFIHLYDEEIFGSNEWADFSEANLSLTNETMLAKYKKNK